MCLRVEVIGKVQGVGYRNFARRQALQLAVNGHALNLPDGRVEVLACGDARALDAFLGKLAEGPAWSSVVALNSGPAPCVGPGFDTG